MWYWRQIRKCYAKCCFFDKKSTQCSINSNNFCNIRSSAISALRRVSREWLNLLMPGPGKVTWWHWPRSSYTTVTGFGFHTYNIKLKILPKMALCALLKNQKPGFCGNLSQPCVSLELCFGAIPSQKVLFKTIWILCAWKLFTSTNLANKINRKLLVANFISSAQYPKKLQ